jgi:hypothetical protein
MTEVGETYPKPADSSERGDSLAKLEKSDALAKKDFNERVLDSVHENVREIVGAIKTGQELGYRLEVQRLGIDRLILLVFATTLLGSVGVMFYLVINDKLSAATSILYPLISLVIGFMSGYFAGTGASTRRKRG